MQSTVQIACCRAEHVSCVSMEYGCQGLHQGLHQNAMHSVHMLRKDTMQAPPPPPCLTARVAAPSTMPEDRVWLQPADRTGQRGSRAASDGTARPHSGLHDSCTTTLACLRKPGSSTSAGSTVNGQGEWRGKQRSSARGCGFRPVPARPALCPHALRAAGPTSSDRALAQTEGSEPRLQTGSQVQQRRPTRPRKPLPAISPTLNGHPAIRHISTRTNSTRAARSAPTSAAPAAIVSHRPLQPHMGGCAADVPGDRMMQCGRVPQSSLLAGLADLAGLRSGLLLFSGLRSGLADLAGLRDLRAASKSVSEAGCTSRVGVADTIESARPMLTSAACAATLGR